MNSLLAVIFTLFWRISLGDAGKDDKLSSFRLWHDIRWKKCWLGCGVSTSSLNNYRKVLSANTSRLEAHPGFFRLVMEGIFYPYLLWPFDKKLISWLVTNVTTRGYTVTIFFNILKPCQHKKIQKFVYALQRNKLTYKFSKQNSHHMWLRISKNSDVGVNPAQHSFWEDFAKRQFLLKDILGPLHYIPVLYPR